MNKNITYTVVGVMALGVFGLIGYVAWRYKKTPNPTVIKEVYNVDKSTGRYAFDVSQAGNVANLFDGEIATLVQMHDAQVAGANWCTSGWAKDPDNIVRHGYYPMNVILPGVTDCGIVGVNVWDNPPAKKVGVSVYGVKPAQNKVISGYVVQPFDTISGTWSQVNRKKDGNN